MLETDYNPNAATEGRDRFILISGCSAGGKSTLLAALQNRGFKTFQEPGRQIVKEQEFIGGPALPWQSSALFAELAASRAMHQMITAARLGAPCFFDRGIPDAVAFFDYLGTAVPKHLENAAHLLRYHRKVFVTPPWPEIFTQDRERRHGADEALAQYEPGLKTLRRLGYEPIPLPKVSVDERVAFVLAELAVTAP